MKKLSVKGEWFIDDTGRYRILRGVNLGGDTKVPYPKGGTQFPTDFSDHKTVSFVNRPFPLEEADEHFTRLSRWGFNCLRLLTTWEAVEHKGPGEYDEEYLDYFTNLVKLAKKYGFYLFVDFHQDVWSRMTGGDGAPAWIFEKIGIDYTKLAKADAALVMQDKYDYSRPGIRQEENYPVMCWSQNYRYAGNAIMWTLFFAGKDFARHFNIDGKNVQDFLQDHYLNSMLEIAKRIKDEEHVLGFDSLNEPGKGFIGRAMNDRGIHGTEEDPAKPGLAWSPIDALYAAQGYSIDLPYLTLSVLKGGFVPSKTVNVNPNRVSIWMDYVDGDPFQLEGAWSLSKDGTPMIERNDFFQKVNGEAIDFDRDYMIPFIRKVAKTIQNVRADWMVFAEREAVDGLMKPEFNAELPPNTVNATHWYDIITLTFKKFWYPITIDPLSHWLVFGKKGIQNMYVRQLSRIKEASAKIRQGVPTLIGEFGIPFDLHAGKAYRKWKSGKYTPSIWKHHIRALDTMYNAMDELFLNNTLWNYTASNQNDLMVGDGWNQEDLSIFSRDQILPGREPDLYGGGGRAIEGFCRPFAEAIQGKPIEMKYSLSKSFFTLTWEVDTNTKEPTIVVLPRFVYPNGYTLETSNAQILREETGKLFVIGKETGIAKISIQAK